MVYSDEGICFPEISDCGICHYFEQYSDYSWGVQLLIYELDGKFYSIEDTSVWEPEEISELEAIQMMCDFEENDNVFIS